MDKPLLIKINLLSYLASNHLPLWGKMSAQHMVEHLIGSFQMSINEIKMECFNPPEKLPVLKKYMMSNRPLPKDFVNPIIGPDLLPLKLESLKDAIFVLRNYVDKYYSFFENNPNALTTNPTFGPLNKIEWDVFHEKHITHHFSQFGLLEKE